MVSISIPFLSGSDCQIIEVDFYPCDATGQYDTTQLAYATTELMCPNGGFVTVPLNGYQARIQLQLTCIMIKVILAMHVGGSQRFALLGYNLDAFSRRTAGRAL
jgi:hypothetical protein